MSSCSSFKLVAERFGLVRITTLALLAGFGVVFAGAGCNEMGGGALGGECLLDSDCQPNLICAYQFCHIPCRESRDCHKAGEECLKSHEKTKNPYNYCAIPPACAQKSECGDFRRCAEDNKCRDMCEHDGECLTDQRCFHGSCRNDDDEPAAGWDAPAGLYEPCGLHSDCASKLCVDRICRGCGEDYDCGDTRTCDTTALDGAGMCRGGIIQLSITPKPVVLDGYVDRAALNSDGSKLYFIAGYSSSANLYSIPIVDGLPAAAPSLICSEIPFPVYDGGDITVSPDDKMLYFTSHDGILQIETQSKSCADISIVQSTKSLATSRVGVQKDGDQDKIYVIAADVGLAYGFAGDSYISPIWGNPETPALDFAIGTKRWMLMIWPQRIVELKDNIAAFPVVDDATAGIESYAASPKMALNLAEDTVYVTVRTNTLDSIIATNLADIYTKREYRMSAPIGIASLGSTHLSRARNKDLFTWVTGAGKLYLFEPL